MVVLNKTEVSEEAATPEIAARLLDRARSARLACLTGDGPHYGPRTDGAVAELAPLAAPLSALDPGRQLADRPAALAFWINLYNALIIHVALHQRVRRSVTEVRGFFRRFAYDVGGQRFTPDVIEHGLLRRNRGHPLRFGLPQLLPGDPRRALVLRPMDRRIHFALNCGAAACPPIRHYSADRIEEQLDLAARAFLAGGGLSFDPQTRCVVLSRLFLWYARDFGWTPRRRLRSILPYLAEEDRRPIAGARRIRYARYDWRFA